MANANQVAMCHIISATSNTRGGSAKLIGPTFLTNESEQRLWLYLQVAGKKRIRVSCNVLMQLIGKYGKQLSSYLGTLARRSNLFPVGVTSWSKMPVQENGDAWEKVTTSDLDRLLQFLVLSTHVRAKLICYSDLKFLVRSYMITSCWSITEFIFLNTAITMDA